MEYKIVEKPDFTFAGVSKRVPVIKRNDRWSFGKR